MSGRENRRNSPTSRPQRSDRQLRVSQAMITASVPSVTAAWVFICAASTTGGRRSRFAPVARIRRLSSWGAVVRDPSRSEAGSRGSRVCPGGGRRAGSAMSHRKDSVTGRIGAALLAFAAALLAGCVPLYLSDTYATSTPRPESFDVGALAGQPVATFRLVAPANLQGFSPTLSHALATALAEVNPPIRELSTFETINRLTDEGLVAEYDDLVSGFGRNWILDRQRLRRIGSESCSLRVCH